MNSVKSRIGTSETTPAIKGLWVANIVHYQKVYKVGEEAVDDQDERIIENYLRRIELTNRTNLERSKVDTEWEEGDWIDPISSLTRDFQSLEESVGHNIASLDLMKQEGKSLLNTLCILSLVTKQKFRRYHSDTLLDQIAPAGDTLSNLTDLEIKKAFVYSLQFRSTEHGIVMSQAHSHLFEELLNGRSQIDADDTESVQEAFNIFSRAMDVCDAGICQLLAVKRISNGKDVNDADLVSMHFAKVLDDLDSKPWSVINNFIDKDLRNAISHGDLLIDVQNNTLKIVSEEKIYDFTEFEDAVNNAIFISDYIRNFSNTLGVCAFERQITWGDDE